MTPHAIQHQVVAEWNIQILDKKKVKKLKQIKKLLMKIKLRHGIALIPIVLSIVVKPFAIAHAYEFRGYHAYGGEMFVIPLGLICAWIICEVAKELEEMLRRWKLRKEK